MLVFTLAAVPAWNDLIIKQPWDGFSNQSVAEFIALHDPVNCENFAALLLNNHMLVTSTRRDKPGNAEFVQKVLGLWFERTGSAVTLTWKDLIGCMKGAGLHGHMIEIIRQNTCKY